MAEGKRGFASMDPERQKLIASQGGKAAHAKGSAHEFTTDEARNAGRKGGLAVSQNREHMSAIGREGGKSRGRNVARRLAEQRAAAEAAARNEQAGQGDVVENSAPIESEQRNEAAYLSGPAQAENVQSHEDVARDEVLGDKDEGTRGGIGGPDRGE
jgi:uncharacterized protein